MSARWDASAFGRPAPQLAAAAPGVLLRLAAPGALRHTDALWPLTPTPQLALASSEPLLCSAAAALEASWSVGVVVMPLQERDGVFMVAFADPSDAVSWAVLLQLALLR